MKTNRRDFLKKTTLASAGLIVLPGYTLNTGATPDTAYDIIVVGGGISGITATIAAARMGVSVLMVEQESAIGGAWTHEQALAPRIGRNTGIFREIYRKLNVNHSLGNLPGEENEPGHPQQFRLFHKTAYMEVLHDLLGKLRKVSILTNATVTGVIKTAGQERVRISGVEITQEGQIFAREAKIIIDATGSAAVAHCAGCPTSIGADNGSGLINPLLNMLIMRTSATAVFPFDAIPGHIYMDKTGLIDGQNSHLANEADPGILFWTYNTITENQQTEQLPRSLDAVLEQIAPQIAMLEKAGFTLEIPLKSATKISRRITGEYTLTAKDIANGNKTESPVYINNIPLCTDNTAGYPTSPTGEQEYGIPFGSLIPLNTEGLLACGNSISGSYEAQTSYQAESAVCGTAEAAGMAAAVAVLYDLPLREVYDNNHFKCALFEQDLMPY